MNKNKFDHKLKKKLNNLSLDWDQEKLDILWNYMNFLFQENKKYNLTGIKKPEAVINKHFMDSLLIFNQISFNGSMKLIDIGTGAGFPGLVLKIFKPALNIVLLDSRLKRINFLRFLIGKSFFPDSYSQNISIIHNRAEELGQNNSYRKQFDVVVSRAVADLNILCEYALPFLKIKGQSIFYKGPEFEKELEKCKPALKKLGGEINNIKTAKLPGTEAERVLIKIKKINPTPDKYPRRPGIPKKRPL